MRATGIIRRIDDLGRIVIPKEIRKTMHIRESDPLEIFTEKDGSIILKKIFPDRRNGKQRPAMRRIDRITDSSHNLYLRPGFRNRCRRP
ncbi:MAG: AbrB/MazE/SpoVT family DNA-binding domain-containing protein [Anaerostipes sp.]